MESNEYVDRLRVLGTFTSATTYVVVPSILPNSIILPAKMATNMNCSFVIKQDIIDINQLTADPAVPITGRIEASFNVI